MPYGSVRWKDGASYSGEFQSMHGVRNGLESDIHGNGYFVFPDGQSYQGEFRHGNKNGHGTYTWPNKYGGTLRLVGNFSNGFPVGPATSTLTDHMGAEKHCYAGTWPGGTWYLTGQGSLSISNLGSFQGRFAHALPVEGIWTDNSGSQFDVRFNEAFLKTKCNDIPGSGLETPVATVMELYGDAVFSSKIRREDQHLVKRERERRKQEIHRRQEQVPQDREDERLKQAQLRQQKVTQEEQDRYERERVAKGLNSALNGGDPFEVPQSLLSQWTNKFADDRKIGEGAFGTVFIGVCEGLPRLAVKRLYQGIRLDGNFEDKQAALFCVRREIKVLSAFRHPSIIKLLGHAGTRNQGAFLAGSSEICLVYELASRGGLDENLTVDQKASDLTPSCRIRIAADISRALNYLHSSDPLAPAYHRDLKSANIALTGDRKAKLVDCGLAKYVPHNSKPGTVMTASQARLGTPGYMCRRYIDTGNYDAKSEIFPLGIILMELLTGRVQSKAAEFDLYATYIEDEEDIHSGLDVRSGAWNDSCVDSMFALAKECTQKYSKRISPMIEVLRRLVSLESLHCVATPEELVLAQHNAELRSELEVLRVRQELNTRCTLPKTCTVCFDEYANNTGVSCPRNDQHFVCKACFSREVSLQVSAESRGFFTSKHSQIVCRQCLPEISAFSDGELARCLDDADFALYREAVLESATALVHQEQEERLQQQIALLRAEMAGGDRQQERVRQHRLHIAERILCLRCPRPECGQAFLDFTGCFALTCNRCHCGFCAYCLEDCGTDAHRHVAHCRFNRAPGKDVYGRIELFELAQRERRERMLAEYLLEKVDERDGEAVRAAVRGDLERLGIRAS